MSRDEDLGSFRIGDKRRPEVRSHARPAAAPAAPASTGGVGFPSVEQQLEGGSIEAFADLLRPSYERLEAMAAKGDVRQKGAARKAMAAYERAADLFEYLFETKRALESR
jgi:hypothetical protein